MPGPAHGVLPVFSRVAIACVAALALTGTYQAWQEVGSWSALFDTTYGELVLTKIELFAVLVAFGAVARSRVASWPTALADAGPTTTGRRRRRTSAAAAAPGRRAPRARYRRGRAVRVGGTRRRATRPRRGRASAPTTSATVTAPLSSTRTVTVRVDPPRHGPVTVELSVSSGPAVQKITLAATQNAAGIGPLPITVRAAAGTGRYRSAPVDLPVAGDWRFTITVQTSAFDIATATPDGAPEVTRLMRALRPTSRPPAAPPATLPARHRPLRRGARAMKRTDHNGPGPGRVHDCHPAFASVGTADAHVTVSAPGAVQGGSDTVITFRVPTESDTASTTGLKVRLPTSTPLLGVLVQPVPGWTVKVIRSKLARPVETDDGPITQAVSEIDWTATGGGTRPTASRSSTSSSANFPRRRR